MGTVGTIAKAVMDGAERESAVRIAREVGDALSEPSELGAGLGGSAGAALLLAELEGLYPREGYAEKAVDLIDGSADAEARDALRLSNLYGGLLGTATVVELLNPLVVEWDLADDPNDVLTGGLLSALGCQTWESGFDLVSGLVGVGAYGLARWPRAGADEMLARVVRHLARLAERTDAGVAWRTLPNMLPEPYKGRAAGGGYIDLGVAHGLPGVVALLGQVWKLGIEPKSCERLALDGLAYLRASEVQAGSCAALPFKNGGSAGDRRGSRLAWCYGSAGAAAALCCAGRDGLPELLEYGVSLGRAALGARVEDSGVVDAGLCHGSGGLCRVFQVLYETTGDAAFCEAARFWASWTIRFRRDGEGLAGYLAYDGTMSGGEPVVEWQPSPGFLTGAAGVGLSLLAAAGHRRTRWGLPMMLDGADSSVIGESRAEAG